MSFLNINTAKNTVQGIEDITKNNTFACPMQQYYIAHYGTFAATILQIATYIPVLCSNGMDLFSKLKGSNSGFDNRKIRNFQPLEKNQRSIINKYGK